MLEMTRRPPAESMRTPTIRQREVGSRASRSKNVVDEARRWRVERLTRRCVTSPDGGRTNRSDAMATEAAAPAGGPWS